MGCTVENIWATPLTTPIFAFMKIVSLPLVCMGKYLKKEKPTYGCDILPQLIGAYSSVSNRRVSRLLISGEFSLSLLFIKIPHY